MQMTSQSQTLPKIHVHASGEGGIYANAYIIETNNGAVAVDTTLTRTESLAFRARIDASGKPLLAVLLTHAHPDHVAGTINVIGDQDVPIVSLASVAALARSFEEPKRAQWKPVFGDEWIDNWAFPNRIVSDREAVTFDGVTIRVYDAGPGGDCDANSIWVMETEPVAAFVGDLVFSGTHVYVADGKVLAWLANIERFRPLLASIATIYPGHGAMGSAEQLDKQRDYLLAYSGAVRDLLGDDEALDENAKQELVNCMEQIRPNAPLEFMISLGADAVAHEVT
jgi:glyoxylase-like metal-dependent hydrolase (beta-lactamase superfamily II)